MVLPLAIYRQAFRRIGEHKIIAFPLKEERQFAYIQLHLLVRGRRHIYPFLAPTYRILACVANYKSKYDLYLLWLRLSTEAISHYL